MTEDKDEMNPSYDDLADTITANLRTMRLVGVRLDALSNTLGYMLSIMALFVLFMAVRNMTHA